MSGSWPKPRLKVGDRTYLKWEDGRISTATVIEILPGDYSVGLVVRWDDGDPDQWFPNDEDWPLLTPLQELAAASD